jgi:hypothetical protein
MKRGIKVIHINGTWNLWNRLSLLNQTNTQYCLLFCWLLCCELIEIVEEKKILRTVSRWVILTPERLNVSMLNFEGTQTTSAISLQGSTSTNKQNKTKQTTEWVHYNKKITSKSYYLIPISLRLKRYPILRDSVSLKHAPSNYNCRRFIQIRHKIFISSWITMNNCNHFFILYSIWSILKNKTNYKNINWEEKKMRRTINLLL